MTNARRAALLSSSECRTNARNLLPATVISRPLADVAPTIDLSLGYNEANMSPLLKAVAARISDLAFVHP
jgi:hypothetical protein